MWFFMPLCSQHMLGFCSKLPEWISFSSWVLSPTCAVIYSSQDFREDSSSQHWAESSSHHINESPAWGHWEKFVILSFIVFLILKMIFFNQGFHKHILAVLQISVIELSLHGIFQRIGKKQAVQRISISCDFDLVNTQLIYFRSCKTQF